ncbi:recombinase family protein [Candidatus Enterovibrio escicola]|nr:recombinase family protein [Candidatus Enterovibrio escacola]
MKCGYARISTQDQNTQVQVAALLSAGCKLVFEEQASGGRWDRPELHRLLEQLRPGDTVVVWKLDRLSRSLKDLLTILEKTEIAGATFLSLTESIDTSAHARRMMMQIVGSFAESLSTPKR